MYYISQVEIDFRNRQKTRDLTHLGSYHKRVEESFPDEIEQNSRSRKLWRIDYVKGRCFLIIVSNSQPSLEKLEEFGVTGSAKTTGYDKFLDRLCEGDIVRFRACLNPVTAKSTGISGERGNVYPCYKIEDQVKFLENRSWKNGFELNENDFSIVARNHELLRKKKVKQVSLNKVTYEGRLKITDINKFKNALTNGIGKEKAYGCGLMTVALVE